MILENINKLILELTAPPVSRIPVQPGVKVKPVSPMLAAKVMQNRKLTMGEFLVAQDNDLIPGQSNLPRPIQMKMYRSFNVNRR
jgi:hypothetical protein